MGQHVDNILTGARRTRMYAEKLIAGIRPEQAARRPRFETAAAAAVIDTNHPTFVYGHLSLYSARILKVAGLDAAGVEAPESWEAIFKAGVPCLDDPTGSIYPQFDVVTAQFFKGVDAAIAGVATLGDDALLRPTPDEKARESFPLTGALIGFLLNNHMMIHMGQVSAWRRCFGLPSAL